MKHVFLTLIVSAFAISVMSPSVAKAQCDPKVDGDCCTKDSDCVPFVHQALCVMMPLNRVAIAEIQNAKLPPSKVCTKEVLAELLKQASATVARCVEESCESEG